MSPHQWLTAYTQTVRDASLPGIWSKGVALGRNGLYTLHKSSDGEVLAHLSLSNQAVGHKIQLWPEDDDWFCDCHPADKADVCAHVIGLILAIQYGRVTLDSPSAGAPRRPDDASEEKTLGGYANLMSGVSLLAYQWVSVPVSKLRSPELRANLGPILHPDVSNEAPLDFQVLALERKLVYKMGSSVQTTPLTHSLVSWIGGQKAGRITAPPCSATVEDLKIDEWFTSASDLRLVRGIHAGEEQWLWIPESRQIDSVFQKLKDLRFVTYQNERADLHTLSELGHPDYPTPTFIIQKDSATISRLPSQTETAFYLNGVIAVGNQLYSVELPKFEVAAWKAFTQAGLRIEDTYSTRQFISTHFKSDSRYKLIAPEEFTADSAKATVSSDLKDPTTCYLILDAKKIDSRSLNLQIKLLYGNPPRFEIVSNSTSHTPKNSADLNSVVSLRQNPNEPVNSTYFRRDVAREASLRRYSAAEWGVIPGHSLKLLNEEAVKAARKISHYDQHLETSQLGTQEMLIMTPESLAEVEAFAPHTVTPKFSVLENTPDHTLGTRPIYFQTFTPDHKPVTVESSFADLYEAYKSGQKFFLAGERFGQSQAASEMRWIELPTQWFERFGDAAIELLKQIKLSQTKTSKSENALLALRITQFAELAQLPDGGEATNESNSGVWSTLLHKLKDPEFEVPENLPKDFKGALRPYQLKGVSWLRLLQRLELGGLLADEMGLGKTLQALLTLPNEGTLIICPTSVLSNWQNQIKEFRSQLSVNLYYGPKRRINHSASVNLTTYGLLRSDMALLSQTQWNTVVVDESHLIKNPRSKTAQSLFMLKARFRIALSGTPVENHLSDLWSQFRFLNPTLLGDYSDFDRKWLEPTRNQYLQKTDQSLAELKTLISPFLLRRRKTEIEDELPPKIENTVLITLSEKEQHFYSTLEAATQIRLKGLEDEDPKTSPRTLLSALEALLRLRQAACDQRLVPGSTLTAISDSIEDNEDPDSFEASTRPEASTKLNFICDELRELKETGSKALVFSQWTSLLDLLEPELKQRKVEFLRIDGSTVNRAAIIDEFQKPLDHASPSPSNSYSGSSATVLLLSLKAGGVGLNLTAADHVFILDPWWNPAVEKQAMDRAHRIGQTKTVFVHRLIAKGTIEERILELQNRKTDLAENVLEGRDQVLTNQDILFLAGSRTSS